MRPVADILKLAADHEQHARHAEAETIYRQLVQAFPHKADYHQKLMEALCRQQRYEDAYSAFGDYAQSQSGTCDPEFDALYLEAIRVTRSLPWPLPRRQRFHGLIELFLQTDKVDARNVAECGCYLGLSSHLLLSYMRKGNPGFRGEDYHIFDSFQGLSTPTFEDDIRDDMPGAASLRAMCSPGAFAAGLDNVRRNLAAFPEVEFHPGWIPLTFRDLPPRDYRFVHVDVDLYDPTLESFEYFYPRLAAGGIIVSDDYSWPGARRAMEEFCAERGLKLNFTAQNQAWLRRESTEPASSWPAPA
jgi:O-methyltransferase